MAWIYSQLFWCLIDKKLNKKEEKYSSASAASNLTNHPGVSQIPLLLSSVADSGSNSKYQFRSDVSFHFFVTCGPCGCATDDNNYDKTMTNAPYNLTQVVRKPGRGVETLSVSCSDKVCLTEWYKAFEILNLMSVTPYPFDDKLILFIVYVFKSFMALGQHYDSLQSGQ